LFVISDTGIIELNARKLNYDQYPDATELVIVSKNKIEFLTLNAAAKLPECKVSGKTLREMIQRGDVPDGHWMQQPYGDGVIYFIDKAILPVLPYREGGGQTGKRNKKGNRQSN
jgi:hypothetical protein